MAELQGPCLKCLVFRQYSTGAQVAYLACVAQYLSGAQIFAADQGGGEPRRFG
jgi:hypothetical protein